MSKPKSVPWRGLFFLTLFLFPVCAFAAPGIAERPGGMLPIDRTFLDETGRSVTLGSLIDRPVVLSFAYFGCKDVCNTYLANLADTFGRMDSVPGRDFTAITMSFDERDTPEDAAYKKRNFLMASGGTIPEAAWRFLVGQPDSINAVTEAAGYEFARADEGFNHPGALVVLSADGKIIRYFYGGRMLPADLEMALLEARDGRVTASIKKAVQFCYRIIPEGREGFFRVLRYAGLATLVFSAVFMIWLATGRQGKRE